ncbi:sigma-70 family RNA polymerase sigma factor [Metasolibacillus fluoroglycofenilyticus]|uniref:sigma-70 family RNA polymerase sigma factor n=1 Tax=Metasolibacillus fluoroglycofenilyticus TaxID=1239396 RepID=UPI000D3918CD|nr:sigma-70 family RNA polymerase sigma factor [Metasolibacillus fluoroglycofenilyticus]
MDEESLLQLLEIQEERFYKISYAYLRNEQDALDAYQELVYRALKHRYKVQQPQYMKTWLVRVLINICLDMKKKRGVTVALEPTLEPIVYDAHSVELDELLAQLSPVEQELIYLKYVEDLKNQDIAARQNIPEGTVKSRIHTTLKKLRHFWKEERG